MNHADYLGGDEAFKVDHFWPTAKGGPWANYANLFLACDRCNQHKSEHWPIRELQDQGVRFLNCCNEPDYGKHVFENVDGELFGVTPAGKFHVAVVKLNRPDLVRFRRKRRQLFMKLFSTPVHSDLQFSQSEIAAFLEKCDELTESLGNQIPWIPLASEVAAAQPREAQ